MVTIQIYTIMNVILSVKMHGEILESFAFPKKLKVVPVYFQMINRNNSIILMINIKTMNRKGMQIKW